MVAGNNSANKKARFLKTLSDETRLKIILFLIKGEQTVTNIVTKVKKAQPTISLNLKLLEREGIVSARKQGKYIFYNIKNKKIIKIIEVLEK